MSLTPWNLNDFNLLQILSSGDVIGVIPGKENKIKDYDALVEKGVTFVNAQLFETKILRIKAGEGGWLHLKFNNNSHSIDLLAEPNDTGKERKVAICLQALYCFDEIPHNVVQIIQPPKPSPQP